MIRIKYLPSQEYQKILFTQWDILENLKIKHNKEYNIARKKCEKVLSHYEEIDD